MSLQPHILVVGDLMLDRYCFGRADRLSPEAPVPVVEVERIDDRPGGAGAVAVMLAALGARVTVIGTYGPDAEGAELEASLRRAGVALPWSGVRGTEPTTLKTRYLARNQQMLRVDREVATPRDWNMTILTHELPNVDCVVLQDYAKGLLTRERCRFVIEAARAAGKPVLVDPSRLRDMGAYEGATAITPNLTEARALCGTNGDVPPDALGRQLLDALGCDACIITQDSQGMTLYRPKAKAVYVSAQAREVFDVTGAGDMVVAVLAYLLPLGADWERAARVANMAAGVEVGHLGATPLTWKEIGGLDWSPAGDLGGK